MYKGALYAIIIVILGIGFVDGEPLEYNSYKGILYGFVIDYPSNWIVEEAQYTFSYIKVSFIEPQTEDYRALVLVGVEELERDISLDEYGDLILAQQHRALQNFTLIESKEDILANNTATMLVYKGIDIDTPVKGKRIYTIYNNTAYTIIASAEEEKFDDYDDIFDNMIDSFSLDSSIIPKPISDMYEDENIKIEFDGWEGLISRIDEDVIIRVTPDINSNTLMNIIITNITAMDLFNEQIRMLFDNGCTIITLNLIDVNGSNALEVMQECNDVVGKSYLFTTTDKVIAVDLITNKEEFNTYDNAFEKSIESIDANIEDITVYLDKEFKTLPKKLDTLTIDIPEGWNVFKKEYNGHEIVYITLNGSEIVRNYTGFLIIEPSLDFNGIKEANNLEDCDITTIHYIAQNIVEEEAFCLRDEIGIELHLIKLDDVTVGYFNTFREEFGIMLENFSNELTYIMNLAHSTEMIDEEYKVILNGTEYNIEYSYIGSTINNIEFDEDDRSLTINALIDDMNAFGMLKIKESLLEEPYIISVNDKVVDIDDADIIAIMYSDDANIKIVGSKVIPEFPLIWILIPLSLSIVIIISYRFKRFIKYV